MLGWRRNKSPQLEKDAYMTQFRRFVASVLIISIAALALPQQSYAAMVSTGSAIASAERDRIATVLNRADVRAQLESMGVKPADVNARLAALTDQEAAQLSAQIDSLPAGGDAVGAIVGAALLVFIVLLITDLLGFTHVFPFTKPIR